MGSADKIIRLIAAVIIAILFFTGVVEGTLGIILLIVAGILVLTSLVGYCGAYTLLGISTCKKKK